MKKAKEIFKSFPTQVCLDFIGTSVCNVKHPKYGSHKLTAHQLKHSPAEFKDALYKNICDALDKDAEFVKEGIYSKDDPIVKTPMVELLLNKKVDGLHDFNRWLKYPELMEVVERLGHSDIPTKKLPAVINKEVADIDSEMMYKAGFVWECIADIRGFEIA